MKEFIVNLEVEKFFPPLSRDAEVLAVVILPNKKILLHRKKFYPPNVYRLLSGGIKKNENVEKALVRELKEETNVKIWNKKLLAKIIFNIKSPKGKKFFTTYIFLVKTKSSNIKPLDSKEQISKLKEIKISELSSVIRKLQSLRTKNWREWGKFRAIAHQIVYEMLKKNSC